MITHKRLLSVDVVKAATLRNTAVEGIRGSTWVFGFKCGRKANKREIACTVHGIWSTDGAANVGTINGSWRI